MNQPSLAENEKALRARLQQTTYQRSLNEKALPNLTWKRCAGLVAGTVLIFTVFRQVFGYAFFVILYYKDGAFKSDPEAVQALSILLQMRLDQFFASTLVFALIAALLVRVQSKRRLVLAALLAGIGPLVPALFNPGPTAAMISRTPSTLLLIALLMGITALGSHLFQSMLRKRKANILEIPCRVSSE